MSTLAKIRQALADTIKDGCEREINVYHQVPDLPQFPAVVIRPESCDFAGTMNRGSDTWKFDVAVLTSRADTTNAQQQLDDFASGGGFSSIREAIELNFNLGLDDTVAFVRALKGYGGDYTSARTRHVGAILKVEINTDGSQI